MFTSTPRTKFWLELYTFMFKLVELSLTGVLFPCNGWPRRVYRYRGQNLWDWIHSETSCQGYGDRHGQVRGTALQLLSLLRASAKQNCILLMLNPHTTVVCDCTICMVNHPRCIFVWPGTIPPYGMPVVAWCSFSTAKTAWMPSVSKSNFSTHISTK